MLSREQLERDLASLREIAVRHRSADAALAVSSTFINGIETPVFTRIPENLHSLYALGLKSPELPFLIHDEQRLSYGETYSQACLLASALVHQFDIHKGDRVCICARNSPEWCLSYMAITMIGAVVVPMNSWWQGAEMKYGLQDSGSRLLIADQERLERLQSAGPIAGLQILTIDQLGSSALPNVHVSMEFARALAPFEAEAHPVAADDDASIMYTSGSTGHPKGVLSTHRAIISALYSWLFVKEVTEILRPELKEDNPEFQPGILANVPLFHVTGSHAQFLLSFLHLRKFVMMYRWNPEHALELIEKERLSVLHGVPTMSWEVMNSPRFDSTDLRSLRSVQSGGAGRPPEHLAMMQKKFPEKAIPGLGYGLTETNAVGATITGQFYLARPDSTGRATQPVTALRIEDENGAVLEAGQIGEICIKGATVMKGYWNQPEETARVLKEGWFHTGDIGLLDEHGFLIIKDRAKDIVIRGGENIGCAEVEYALAEHPEVCEVAVFGLPDERLGEILAATVMVQPQSTLTDLDLQSFLQGRLAQFKIPSRIFVQTQQLPRIASGKIAKKQIRESVLKSLTTS